MSALSGYQIRHSFEVIDAVAARLETQLPTGVLNRVVRDAFAKSQPPFSRGKQLKFYYATQTGRKPPRVTLFVNDPALSTPGHQAFLTARLREAFDLAGVPSSCATGQATTNQNQTVERIPLRSTVRPSGWIHARHRRHARLPGDGGNWMGVEKITR